MSQTTGMLPRGSHGFLATREGASLVWRFGKHTVVVDRERYRTG